MASITIRNLDDDVKTRLRVRAAENGRSIRALRVTHRDPKWSVMKPNPEIRSRVFVVDTDAATPRERRDLLDQLIREHLKFEELFPTTVKISVPQNGKAEELALPCTHI